MSAQPAMNDWGLEIAPRSPAAERRDRRREYLPVAIERTEAKLIALRREAKQIGLNLPRTVASHRGGDLIATEQLKRLGYFR